MYAVSKQKCLGGDNQESTLYISLFARFNILDILLKREA